jgi:hypothetical protein
MNSEATLSPADILTEVIDPDRPTFSPQFAREVLAFHFNDGAKARIRELLQRRNAGAITAAEQSTLDSYLRVGEFLDILQAKARVTLRQSGAAAP